MTDRDDGHDHEDGHDGAHDHTPEYVAAVEAERARKDAWFKSSRSSPLPHEARHDFTRKQTFSPFAR